MFTWVGLAMCALRPSRGEVPVTAYWDTMPRKDIIARRPFLISFTFMAGESWPVGSKGKLPTPPDSPVAMNPRMRAASRKPITTIWIAIEGLDVPVAERGFAGLPELGEADGVREEDARGGVHRPAAVHELSLLEVGERLGVRAEAEGVEA